MLIIIILFRLMNIVKLKELSFRILCLFFCKFILNVLNKNKIFFVKN